MKAASHSFSFLEACLDQKSKHWSVRVSPIFRLEKSISLGQGNLRALHRGRVEDYSRRMSLNRCMLHRAAVCLTASVHPQNIAQSLPLEGLSEHPREMLVWEWIVLNGYVVTISTENYGNPLCLDSVAMDSRSSLLKPLKMDSFSEGPQM